jgi:coproporphyrinogen III oxidase-like Fe-S oxidoreductase
LRGLPSEDASADMYEATQDLCEAAGMPAYEVSNHAKAGAASRHNLIYWRAGDYAGVGPGAHGRISQGISRKATRAEKRPDAWLAAVERRGDGDAEVEDMQPTDRALEYALMSLRLVEGMDIVRFQELGGRIKVGSLDDLTQSGHIRTDGHRLRTTAAGRLVLNAVLRQLLV